MPQLMGKDPSETHKTLNGFQFSATQLDKLGASEYTIVTIVQDVSGSVMGFASDMEATIQKIVEACRKSPRSENLLLRLVTFNDRVQEVHGFVELNKINVGAYTNSLHCYGTTALKDAVLNSVEAMETYGDHLDSMDYRSNGVMFIITDGQDNASVVAKNPVVLKKAIRKVKVGEIALESFISVLVCVSEEPNDIQALKDLKQEIDIDQFIEMGQVTPTNLAKLADFISRSISSASQSLANGQPSQPLTF
jgi:uncharacterized protein YegL